MSDLDDEELEATRIKTVRQAYNTIYSEMRRYMDLYNQAEKRIAELEETIDKLTKKQPKVTEKELKDMIIGMLE